MGKLPAFFFYPKDWLTDLPLCVCSKGAKGVWADMLCLMFGAPNRGVLAYADGRPWSDQEIAEAIGGNTATNLGYIAELLDKGVCHRDKKGAIFSRRSMRDEADRKSNTKRQRKHRKEVEQFKSNSSVTVNVTPLSGDGVGDAKDFDSQFLEKEDLEPPKNYDELVEKIAHLHPANWREFGKRLIIPHAECIAIREAIKNHGVDLVLAGTKNYAEAVEKWPKNGRARAVKGVVRFFSEEDFLKDPIEWEQGNGQTQQLSKTEERFASNARAAAASLGMGYSGNKNGDASRPTETPSGDGRRLQTLAGRVSGKVPSGD